VGRFSAGAGTNPSSATFSPNGQLLITTNESKDTVTVFNVAANGALSIRQTAVASASVPSATRQATFHPSGKLVAIANPSVSGAGGNVRLSAFDANNFLTALDDIDTLFVASSVDFNPRGDLLAVVVRALQSVYIYKVGAPTITLNNATTVGPPLPDFPFKRAFTCADAPYAPGIASCVDQDGGASGVNVLDVSSLGPHSYTVTATSLDGQTTTVTHDYTVIAGPTVTLVSPADGGVYTVNQVVPTSFFCDSAPGGATLIVCSDSVSQNATPGQTHLSVSGHLNTATPGVKTYRVAGCAGPGFFEGGCGTQTITYTVVDVAATTTLTNPVVPSGGLVGQPLTVTTTLARTDGQSSCVAAQSVVFTWTLPGGGTTTQTATTAANGVASVSFTPTAKGVHTVSASFSGGTCLQASTSPSGSSTVLQPMALSLAATAGVCGAPIDVSATLRHFTDGGTVAPPGLNVMFTFSGPGAPAGQLTQTDADGVASVQITCPAAGSITAQATFSDGAAFYTDHTGSLPARAETSSASLTATSATTSLVTTAPGAGVFGQEISVSATLSRVADPAGPVAGRWVTFDVTGPVGTFTIGATTDANGVATATIVPPQRGSYSVTASFAGDSCLQAITSAAAPFNVFQRTALSLSPNPITTTPGVAITVTASLMTENMSILPDGQMIGTPGVFARPLDGQAVTFNFGGGAPTQTAVTDANGEAAVVVVFPNSGSFTVTAVFLNAAAFFTNNNGSVPPVAETSSVAATATAAATTLSNVMVPTGSLAGNALMATVTLSRHDGSGACLAGQPIAFNWTLPNGSTTSLIGTSGAEGTASVSFAPGLLGGHTVTASFAGSACLAAAASSTSSPVTVYQRTSIAVAPVTVVAGHSATVSATLASLPGSAPLAGQTVLFAFSGPGAPALQTAVTNGGGTASVTGTFAVPGTVTVTASFVNVGAFFTDGTGAIPPVATVATAVVTVTNNAPNAGHDEYSTPANTPITVAAPGVLANDSDADGHAITAVKLSNPSHGSVTLSASGGFTYTPAASYFGPDSFTYTTNDGVTNGNTATVSFTVLSPAQVAAQVSAILSAIDPRLANDVQKVLDKKPGCNEVSKLKETITKDKKYTAQQKQTMLAAVATLSRSVGCSN
jgi:hypothetical protein